MNRYILRDGQVISSPSEPNGLDVYSYVTGYGNKTHMLLSDHAEVAFLLRCADEAGRRFID